MSDDTTRRAGDEESGDDAADLMRSTTGAADAGGATTGAHIGAVAGAAAGPLGAIAGGTVGGLAGWIAGSRVRDGEPVSEEEDERFRGMHESTADAERMPYDHVRELYWLGHRVRQHPDLGRRDWNDIEPELRDAWTGVQSENWGEWAHASRYVRRGYEHTD
ncbi:MAG TPA: hypothetical protein VFZ69_07305 [Longimicrobiales bacterium]